MLHIVFQILVPVLCILFLSGLDSRAQPPEPLTEPVLVGSIQAKSSGISRTTLYLAHDPARMSYIANGHEVVAYDWQSGDMESIAGTGENGAIRAGNAVDVSMSFTSISLDPDGFLYILDDENIGRLERNGTISILDFPNFEGTKEETFEVVHSTLGELFVSTLLSSDGLSRDFVIDRFVGGQRLPFLGRGNAVLDKTINRDRLEIKIVSTPYMRFVGETLYFISDGNLYRILSSGRVDYIAELSRTTFLPFGESYLLYPGTLPGRLPSNPRFSISILDLNTNSTRLLVEIPQFNTRIRTTDIPMIYDEERDSLLLAVDDSSESKVELFFWEVPNLTRFLQSGVPNWSDLK